MSTKSTTFAFTPAASSTGTDAVKRPGFFTRMFERMIAARTNQARVQVAGHLARLSEARLKDLGFTPDEVRAVREKGKIPASYWQ